MGSTMSAVTQVSASNTRFIDDLLSSRKWGGDAISFGFSQAASVYGANYGRGEAASFRAFNPAQQKATLDAMAMWGELIELDIVQTNASAADIRLGVSSMPATAWAYTPSIASQAGDVWLGTTYLSSPNQGNYAYFTIMHEIGHALGLRHPHEGGSNLAATTPDDGLCPCCGGLQHAQTGTGIVDTQVATAAAKDAMAWSIMSYRSYEGQSISTGYTNETHGYAQSPMARDIAAVQHLYGANYGTRAGDTVYGWSETTGEKFINGVGQGKPGANKVFETIWDGGGRDTFDLSNFSTNLTIDLTPGGWTSFGNDQRAGLGNGQLAPGNVAVAYLYEGNPLSLIENAIGGSGNDTITGNQADNVLVGGAGNDTIQVTVGRNVLIGDTVGTELELIGLQLADLISVDLPPLPAKAGNDILIGGAHNDVFIPGLGANVVKGGGGTDTLVLDVLLDDLTITGDPNKVMTIVYAGGSVEVSDVEILAVRDGIYSLVGPIGELETRQFTDDIILLYSAGLGRAPDAPGLDYWVEALANGTELDGIALSLLDSPEFSERFGTGSTLQDPEYVKALYLNVLGREGDAEGLEYWQGQLADGTSRTDLLLAFAYSDENRANAAMMNGNELDLVAVTRSQWAEIWGG